MNVASAGEFIIIQCVEDGRGGSCCGFARFTELASFVMHLTGGEYMGNLCDGEGDKGFTTLTKVGSQVAYGLVVDPDPVRFVTRCMTYLAGRQGANVPETSIGLSVPVSGFVKPDTFCIVTTLPYAVIHRRVGVQGVSLIVVQPAPCGLRSEVRFWGIAKAVVGCSPCAGGT